MKFYITCTLIAVLIILPIYLFIEYENKITDRANQYFAKPNWQIAVEDKLVDPESATFKDVTVNDLDGRICGKVNSKNSFGGYSGFRKFLILPSIEDKNEIWRTMIEGGKYDGIIKVRCH